MKNKHNKKLVAKTNASHEMFKILSKLGITVKFSSSTKNTSYSWDNVYDCWEYARKYGSTDE